MKQKIELNCDMGIRPEIEADVVGKVGIHRPLNFKVDENDQPILEDGKPIIEISSKFWRLTHVSSGLALCNARTKEAAIRARKILNGIDLDYVASMPPEKRAGYLPVEHELRKLLRDGSELLSPGWIWDD